MTPSATTVDVLDFLVGDQTLWPRVGGHSQNQSVDLARREGTIVIPARKGGDLRAYLASLRRIRDLAPRRLLPGHGPIIDNPVELVDQYIAHREQREQQILKAILDGARTVEEIVRRVYPALPASLSDAAADSVRAHLVKLRDEGRA